jgi:hypothetical protein
MSHLSLMFPRSPVRAVVILGAIGERGKGHSAVKVALRGPAAGPPPVGYTDLEEAATPAVPLRIDINGNE